jgi:hypothetical protein
MFMLTHKRFSFVIETIFIVSLAGCSGSSGFGADGGADADTDSDTDADTDTGADTDTDVDTDTGTGTGDGTGDYFPLSVGNFWEYTETDAVGTTALRYEITGFENVAFGNGVGAKDVFVEEDTFPGTSTERRVQYLEDDGVRVVRDRHLVYDTTGALTKERDYVPGFLRFDRSKIAVGDAWSETVTTYTDTLDGTPITTGSTSYDYVVLAVDAPVTVPAGTFGCLSIQRTKTSSAPQEVKIYSFARGVGKVKEVTQGSKEEALTAYSVAP